MCIESRAEKKNNQKDFNNNKNLFCIFWLGKLPKLAAQKHQNENVDYSQTSGPTRQSCGSSCFGDPRTRNNEHLKKKNIMIVMTMMMTAIIVTIVAMTMNLVTSRMIAMTTMKMRMRMIVMDDDENNSDGDEDDSDDDENNSDDDEDDSDDTIVIVIPEELESRPLKLYQFEEDISQKGL